MIRTYTRKPQVCRYIEGATSLCRLCLERADEGVPIFADDPAEVCSSLALRVMICVGLEVKREDCLPNLICKACSKELEKYYAFRKKCEVSYQKLKSHLQAYRIRQAMETITSENVNVKDGDPNQDENMNINDLGLIVEECTGNYNKSMELESASVINHVRSQTPVAAETVTRAVTKKTCHTIEPEQLTSMITSVLVELGVLARRDGQLTSLHRDLTRIQLETGDGRVIQMQLVEEEDVPESPPAAAEPAREEESLLVARPDAPGAASEESRTKKQAVKTCGVRGVVCPECGRAFASRAALRRHARTHSGERPFACPDCARRFAQREVMRRHRLVHAAVRPHQCPRCPKSFTQRNSLRLHERSHLPPLERALALHSCPHCPKLFLHSSGLSRHMMTHSGRVYECGACRRQFADKSSVLRHVKRAQHGAPEAAGPGAASPGAPGAASPGAPGAASPGAPGAADTAPGGGAGQCSTPSTA